MTPENNLHDSGERKIFAGGYAKDPAKGELVDYTLVFDGPMFERWALHLARGAKKYAKRNWMKAEDAAAMAQFKESAARHFVQWLRGDTDEDHASAMFFNVNCYEYVKEKLK